MLMYALDSHASMPIADAVASLKKTMGLASARCEVQDEVLGRSRERQLLRRIHRDTPTIRSRRFWIEGAREAKDCYIKALLEMNTSLGGELIASINPPMLAVVSLSIWPTSPDDDEPISLHHHLERQRVLTVRRKIAILMALRASGK